MLEGFSTIDVDCGGVRIRARTAGQGTPLLLLHGHPQTHAIWHRVAPALAAHHAVVLADLRGYGDSERVAPGSDHSSYSKRAMAGDMLRLMRALGHERFAVCGHDRGARVAHRLGLDHGAHVTRMMLLDIAPTLSMYEHTTEAFARAYWHWFFLIQPAPLPERLIEADPPGYLRALMGSRHGGLQVFAPEAWAEYERCISLPGTASSMCEDYRAAAGIDLEHDRADRDRGHRLTMPVRVLWGAHGIVARCFAPLALWQPAALDLGGRPLDCGHYIPEEAPDALLREMLDFFPENSR